MVVKGVRGTIANIINIGNIDQFTFFAHVSGNGVLVDGDRKGVINELFSRAQPSMKRIILGVTELELVTIPEIDGSCVGIEKFSGIGEDSLQEEVQIFHLSDVLDHSCDGIQLVFCAQHDERGPLLGI